MRVDNDTATRVTIAAENALVDREAAGVVDALDERVPRPGTLVVVTPDLGNPDGQWGLWGHPVRTDPPYMHGVTFRVL